VSIAGRFEAALRSVTEPELDGPELLPVRLTRACVQMLPPVDGAGISLTLPDGRRIPLGASSEAAAVAERLQFTAGSGPCMAAQDAREPVFALRDDLHRRWPTFAELLERRAPYCAVIALPLREAIAGLGALDLFFTRDDAVPEVDVFEAMAVADLVTSALSETAVWSTWTPGHGPQWLHGPTAQRRAAVWDAMGVLALALGVPVKAALSLLRAAAHAQGRTVDDVAADLLGGRLRPGDLRAPGEDPG
jgi:hypothetical protein